MLKVRFQEYDDTALDLNSALREIDEIHRIVIKFAHELLDDPGEHLNSFHFGCNADRIEWDDSDFSHMEIAPKVTVYVDFHEVFEGAFNAMSPQGIHHFLFSGRYRRKVNQSLTRAVELERESAGCWRFEGLRLKRRIACGGPIQWYARLRWNCAAALLPQWRLVRKSELAFFHSNP